MNRALRVILLAVAAAVLALAAGACGTQRISVPKSDPTHAQDLVAAHLFNERCAGCHTLSYAGTHGSAANPRTAQAINGPNFNVRCERPAIRVLYAIENGGFSGAYMPQNIFVGQQAREVAAFVAKFAGREAPVEPDATSCTQEQIGSLPALPNGSVSASTANPSAGNPALTSTTPTATSGKKRGGKTGKTAKKPKKK
ncbi:MAG TPA: c-type cytochrome [Solirubrobacteraceae bacterium]|jgi:mono/diheme cytochrome c family protein|nr:c-type cytochrome [Solirubrobacteraceae bacterium]